jgi:multicomponent Na+:H+ antiporter subunit G
LKNEKKMSELFIMILSGLGAVFVLLAAIGLVRMPDLYLRISVTTKAATLGIGLLLGAAAIYFNEGAITTRVLAIVFFIILTAPIGAHLLGRASYFTNVPLWDRSKTDRLKGKYDKKTHRLKGLESDSKVEENP